MAKIHMAQNSRHVDFSQASTKEKEKTIYFCCMQCLYRYKTQKNPGPV